MEKTIGDDYADNVRLSGDGKKVIIIDQTKLPNIEAVSYTHLDVYKRQL